MNKSILIVGAGNLGRRHLQSLKLSQNPLEVYVVDSSDAALSLAKEAVEQAEMKIPVSYFSNLDVVQKLNIDVGIVATTASSRLPILKTLIENDIKNIVLEKIVFNSLQDIDDALLLTSEAKNTKIWVNCPRRLYPVYQQLKKDIKGSVFKRFSVKGNNFGMGCNGIHFIDLLAYLIDDSKYQFSSEKITDVEESKRADYVELFGIMDGYFESGCQLELECGKNSEKPEFEISLEMEDGSLNIRELTGEAVLNKSGSTSTLDFNMPYQSELTGPLIDQILQEGTCGLTSFNESMALHRPFIAASYKPYATRFGENDKKLVPLT
jgi:predicted dehydrogenase